jgi:hypothetical protein
MGAQQTTRRPLTGRYSTVFLVLTVHCTYLLRPGCERLHIGTIDPSCDPS